MAIMDEKYSQYGYTWRDIKDKVWGLKHSATLFEVKIGGVIFSLFLLLNGRKRALDVFRDNSSEWRKNLNLILSFLNGSSSQRGAVLNAN